ncbi:MAG TPA: hypothetical protein VGQ41_05775 [Pyrinomonadaceae bacterium]|jgi:hypothetical protein|nr:hypothetical protein [Pyrinomonadaceae bacterium]
MRQLLEGRFWHCRHLLKCKSNFAHFINDIRERRTQESTTTGSTAMGLLNFLTRTELEKFGPPTPEEFSEIGVSPTLLGDLALKHLSLLQNPTAVSIAAKLHLPPALIEELLYQLYREKLIEMRLQSAGDNTRYAMLDQGWEHLAQLKAQCGYLGPAPVSLEDYAFMMRLQAGPSSPASIETVRRAFADLVLPESLLQTLGCVINSRSALFLSGPPGSGKTAVAERINAVLAGSIWIPYAVEAEGEIIRIYDPHCHTRVVEKATERDSRWVEIERPLIMVGGELTLENTGLWWSDSARFYDAPVQIKSNGGTLVIDDFGRQRIDPRDLLNRWILPLERRVDYLSLRSGKKIELPFEQLVVFSTNLDEDRLVDEAFLRRFGYRARIESPSIADYTEIFKRAAARRQIAFDQASLSHLLKKYVEEGRAPKSCEPRDLLNRVSDICQFRGLAPHLSSELIDLAWNNYFGRASVPQQASRVATIQATAEPTVVTS